MEIDITQELKNFDGSVLKNEKGETLTVGDTCLRAIGLYQAEDQANSVKMYELGLKISGSKKKINLKSEDVTVLKKSVSEVFKSPVISGQICKIIEGEK